MKKSLGFLALLALIFAGIESCKHKPDDTIEPIPSPTDTTTTTSSDTCSLDTVYFVNDILPIIVSNCAKSGCHDAISPEDDIDLTTYDKIIKNGEIRPGDASESKLYEVLLKSDPDKIMPPPPATITPEQRNAIRIWINQGAKNNKCSNRCDTSNVTFSGNVWPIIEATCRGCHSGSGASGGVKITNYTQIKALVDNGNLENVLSRKGPKKAMPPGGPLEKCASDQIRIWIAEGAKDN
ncbi:MAG: cytochrome c5 [Bacteroidia bacterium]|jgi:cytochrome c5